MTLFIRGEKSSNLTKSIEEKSILKNYFLRLKINKMKYVFYFYFFIYV